MHVKNGVESRSGNEDESNVQAAYVPLDIRDSHETVQHKQWKSVADMKHYTSS